VFDRSGKQLGRIGEKDFQNSPRISPDGQKVAVEFGNTTGVSDISGFTA